MLLHRLGRRVSSASPASSSPVASFSSLFPLSPCPATARADRRVQWSITTTRRRHTHSSCLSIDDEYNSHTHASATSDTYQVPGTVVLESAESLVAPVIAYTTYGSLNAARDNVIVVCHALTGHSLVHHYWDAMVTSDWTRKYFVVCCNVVGSCYGSTGPTSTNPLTGRPYGPDFPAVTIRDAVALQRRLLQEKLGVRQVRAVIGGSLGGMQTLEWMFQGRGFVQSVVAIACGAQHSAWQIGMSELQRQAIRLDPHFCDGYYQSDARPEAGLALARRIAMVSYRSHAAYNEKFGRSREHVDTNDDDQKTTTGASKDGRFLVQSYLDYQGAKFLARFDVNSYLTLLHMMDTHDVGRDRGGVAKALASVSQPALVIGIDSDVLYPLCEQQQLAHGLPNAQFITLSSLHGHDGFLLGQKEISEHIKRFLAEHVE